MDKYIIFPILFIFLISCNKDEPLDDEIQDIIMDEIVILQENTSAPELVQIYEDSEILVFGETHYVQEHQDFMISQLEILSEAGYRIIFQELFHCFSWIVNDYIKGNREDIPEFILFFDETLIEGVKAFNSTVDDSLHFSIEYMDMNHWTSNFLTCIAEIEMVLGEQEIFSAIKEIVTDSPSYKLELLSLYNEIIIANSDYKNLWGNLWFDRITGIIDKEIASAEYRINRSDSWRESVMFENIYEIIGQGDHQKSIVNTGFFHAQKETFMGTSIERLSSKLLEVEDKTTSIVFVGMKGELKSKFSDTDYYSVDLESQADSNDMIKEIGMLAGSNMSLFPLTNEMFYNTNVNISYASGKSSKVTIPIGKQFDAIITYPEVSILDSMEKYNWN